MSAPTAPPPDDKDWTWSTERPCPECGYDPGAVADEGLGEAIRATSTRWSHVLDGDDLGSRPQPQVWSPLEYACHVRDVHRVFAERVRMMLDQDDPQFANWDQDASAVSERYWEQDPAAVAVELAAGAQAAAAQYDAVPPGDWHRSGRRSNGSVFTISSIGRYHLHDVMHHLHDVQG
jgi:hypothetical protein